MSTMNISLPDALKCFVDAQVKQGSYGTSSEYVRELIRKDQERLHLRSLLLAGAESAPAAPVSAAYFEDLRNRVRKNFPARRSGVNAKPVVPREQANRDIDEAIAYFLDKGADHAALGFIDSLEQAYAHIGSHPASGSLRYAHELRLPESRFWPLARFPYLVFYLRAPRPR